MICTWLVPALKEQINGTDTAIFLHDSKGRADYFNRDLLERVNTTHAHEPKGSSLGILPTKQITLEYGK